jgi:hypothetical protein
VIDKAKERMRKVRAEPTYGQYYFAALQRQIRKKGATEWCQ